MDRINRKYMVSIEDTNNEGYCKSYDTLQEAQDHITLVDLTRGLAEYPVVYISERGDNEVYTTIWTKSGRI